MDKIKLWEVFAYKERAADDSGAFSSTTIAWDKKCSLLNQCGGILKLYIKFFGTEGIVPR